jgi:hypothetical protein
MDLYSSGKPCFCKNPDLVLLNDVGMYNCNNVFKIVTACVLSDSGIVTMNLKQCRRITNELPKLKQ